LTLATYEPHPRDWIEVLPRAAEVAKAIANTDFVPQQFRGNPAAITAAILYGDEVGLGPMQSLAKIAVIEGRPSLAAEAQRGLILAAGHELWIEDASVTRVVVAGRRRDSEQTSRVTWTIDDAKRANLVGKHNWRTYPRQMLIARATAELARAIFADVIGGLAATEEIADDTAQIVSESEQPTKRPRRRALSAVQTTEAPAETEPTPAVADVPETPEATLSQVANEYRTPQQARKLNVLVGKLRTPGHITTEQLYRAMGEVRSIEPDLLADVVHGRDDEGGLHWAPLRDSLDRSEADGLIQRLVDLEQRLQTAPRPTNGPSLGDLAHLSALMLDRGLRSHQERCDWLTQQVGRPIEDPATLTAGEVRSMIDWLTTTPLDEGA